MEEDDGFSHLPHQHRLTPTNADRTNVKAFAVSHNGYATDGTEVDDSKSSIKLTATAVVAGKIEIVTTTQTTDGVEAPHQRRSYRRDR